MRFPRTIFRNWQAQSYANARNNASSSVPLHSSLKSTIESAWESRDNVSPKTSGGTRDAVEEALSLLDSGRARVAEPVGGQWVVHDWLKQAILLAYRLNDKQLLSGMPIGAPAWDRLPLKFSGWTAEQFSTAGFRVLPGAIVRRPAHIGRQVVVMPSYINVGAFVDDGSMVDAWSTVGSCAQIGKNVHISGGVGIGGVLEPEQNNPTIIEDNCFIGARSEVVEGCIIREGSVLGMGVYIGKSTKIIDRETGEIHMGEVPPYSVIVSGALPGRRLPGKDWGPSVYCAIIVKKVDARTRSKTAINDLLRQ